MKGSDLSKDWHQNGNNGNSWVGIMKGLALFKGVPTIKNKEG